MTDPIPSPERLPPSAQSNPPTLALVGRPNVGKSTLFNRLTRTRKALVAPIPGVTRDRREGFVRQGQLAFRLIDTGGMAFSDEVEFSKEIAAQIRVAVAAADAVWLVLDAAAGLNPFDAELFRTLQKSGKPVIVVANKADSPGRREGAAEFYALGADTVFPISALHGNGIAEALEATAAWLPAPPTPAAGNAAADASAALPVRVAFVGRPNVGKSSLVNRLIGAERQIVSEIAGTTREAIEIPFRVGDQDFVLVDTAGIRRRARTKEYLEKLSVVNALAALDHVDVAVLVVDAPGGVAEQDARIAGYILEKRRGIVVAMNKWDQVSDDARAGKELEADIEHTLRFLDFAPRVRISAQTGFGLERLFKEVRAVAREFARDVQTADVNRVLQLATRLTPPPMKGRSATKILYGTQTGSHPPTFRFFTNHPEAIPESYRRFFENQLRFHFGFKGTPLRVEWRGREGGGGDAPAAPRPAPRSRPPLKRKPAPPPLKRKPAPPRRSTSGKKLSVGRKRRLKVRG